MKFSVTEKIGRDDNFFELGGDSLRATQVINRVRAQFEVNLSIATIFRKASVGELAVEIAHAIQDTGREDLRNESTRLEAGSGIFRELEENLSRLSNDTPTNGGIPQA